MDKSNALDVSRALCVHRGRYTPEQVARIIRHIRRVSDNVSLANDDQASDFGNNKTGAGKATPHSQAGKTRAQPRAYGGRFGRKGATNGEQAAPGENQQDPEQFVAVVYNLQIGQSVALPGNVAKVRRLGNGYQLVKMDGSENRVVKDIKEATNWVRQNAKLQLKKGVAAANGGSKPPA